ncbi:hypothetical protein ASG04_12695 [Curtobacterium sp. Leaf183]|uniref:hypothetical protein n=1 Tax=Curtobacterium sp. Leaf183 TaxID=1736291 RepID=UPI0006F79B4B|nr:hypothetical protein [Curtobacterium sp. Leaf183]KQS08002.1 hypothetical protein ASG04_12695 [Curtobacterium sp. Leaf183]
MAAASRSSWSTSSARCLDVAFEVATAYCTNEDKAHDCPSWVDSAFQNPVDRDSGKRVAAQSDTDTDATDGSVTLSYQPLGPVTEPSSGESGLDADD